MTIFCPPFLKYAIGDLNRQVVTDKSYGLRRKEKKMATIKDLEQWMTRLTRYSKMDKILIKETEQTNQGIRYRMYTDKHCYSIVAHERESGGYLGCTVLTRKPRAGEEHNRGNDLADGKLTQETWYKIMYDIIGYELVEITPGTPV